VDSIAHVSLLVSSRQRCTSGRPLQKEEADSIRGTPLFQDTPCQPLPPAIISEFESSTPRFQDRVALRDDAPLCLERVGLPQASQETGDVLLLESLEDWCMEASTLATRQVDGDFGRFLDASIGSIDTRRGLRDLFLVD